MLVRIRTKCLNHLCWAHYPQPVAHSADRALPLSGRDSSVNILDSRPTSTHLVSLVHNFGVYVLRHEWTPLVPDSRITDQILYPHRYKHGRRSPSKPILLLFLLDDSAILLSLLVFSQCKPLIWLFDIWLQRRPIYAYLHLHIVSGCWAV